MKAAAYAKVNLALSIYARSADGYHPLRGIFQSVSLADTVEIVPASSDAITVSSDEAPADETNLAWKAVEAVRRAARETTPVALSLDKRIPSGAGLGGGSADAAAALGLASEHFSLPIEAIADLAEALGSDVPFSYTGGTALVEGRGERIQELEPLDGFALGIVVPPFSLSTPAVFQEWDRLDEPKGEPLDEQYLPPALRGGLPMRNDLLPAAVSLDPRVGEWRDELMHRWGTAVALTGSGSALFAFFSTIDEAESAVASIDLPTRAAEAVVPVRVGWEKLREDSQ